MINDYEVLGLAVVVGTKAGFDFLSGIEEVAEDVLALRIAMRHKWKLAFSIQRA